MKKFLINLYNEMEEKELQTIKKTIGDCVIIMKKKRNGVYIKINDEDLFFSNRMKWSWNLMYEQYIKDKYNISKKL